MAFCRSQRLYRKADGHESRLCFMGHVLMESRSGLAADATVTQATGTAEREATLAMLDRRKGKHRNVLGADKAYDVMDFIGDLCARKVTPHIAVDGVITETGKTRKTAMDRRTLRHARDEISQRIRMRTEDVFRLVKKPGGVTKAKVHSKPKVDAVFTFTVIAYNLIRLPKLMKEDPA